VVRRIVGFIFAVMVTFSLGAIASTQSVISSLADMGAPLTVNERLSMTLHDLVGMLPLYGSLVAIGFLLALPVAGWASHRLGSLRVLGFVLAGALAVFLVHAGLHSIFGTSLVAGARSTLGLSVQILAGAIGGYCYLLIRDEPRLDGHTRKGER